MTKSPLTGGWGDPNASGSFGVALKRAGFDAVFFTGMAAQPVYLYLDNGRAELRDACDLWGKDCYEIEDWIKSELGQEFEGACIGPAGEKQALISAIVHAKGRTAARSGVGAVMGAKRLKLIAVRGAGLIPLADPVRANQVRHQYVKEITHGAGASDFYRQTGTPGYLPFGIKTRDAPTRNWGASGPAVGETSPLEFSVLLPRRVKRQSCWHCPMSCWGTSRVAYGGETIEAHQPDLQIWRCAI